MELYKKIKPKSGLIAKSYHIIHFIDIFITIMQLPSELHSLAIYIISIFIHLSVYISI